MLKQNITEERKRRKQITIDIRNHERAREILREAGLKTQQQMQYHISDITSLALEAVFIDDPYKLQVEFIERRNKTECDLSFRRGEDVLSPLDATGGGAVDVASFALRVASYSMQTPRTLPIIILDEPMRFLSRDNQKRASSMIKELSEKIGICFIIVTHEPTLAEAADRVFRVEKQKGISRVTMYNQEVVK